MLPVVILGCGYTGTKVAKLLKDKNIPTIATTRNTFKLGDDTSFIPKGARVLYSIPDVTEELLQSLNNRSTRVVHLSTTGVYGDIKDVDHRTQPNPRTERELERFRQEELIRSGPWPTLTLRAAAIYGPGRGVHVNLKASTGTNYISRIHVDDLAAHAEAALFSDLTGAFPVADEEPCPSSEVAAFSAQLLGLPLPPPDENLPPTRQSNRQVDGSEIRRLLNVKLRYPSYRYGVPASIVNPT